MKKKLFIILVLIAIVSLALAACERPASVAPIPTATKEGEIPFPVATKPQIMEDILAGTQTALALTPQSGVTQPPTGTEAPGATATPAFIFDTPEATATATAIIYPTPTPGRPKSWKIQEGEFLYCIARRFDVSVGDLLAANGMNMNSQPAVGTKLTIPQSGSFGGERALHAHPATYTVLAGDTIGKIACYYGDVAPDTIMYANGLQLGAKLKPGQILQIP
ncbi:MAG TPA: LysM peptidoglycan-binding domain-containing protein [Anaerolineaceae bacterium]|nr:LysM peptidoglycan-binding domain-containing protein [Anaerolineaceae bacterium]